MPDIRKTTPSMPIRLPTNSTVEPSSASAGAHNKAINAPTTIIGTPTPKLIALEPMKEVDVEIYMKFMLIVVTLFQFSE